MDASKQSNCTFLSLGAIIQDFSVNGHPIALGFATEELYKKHNSPYFGETIGRVANRVSGARIDNLDGKSWPLAANNGPNSLHGGPSGWGKKTFEGPILMNRNGKETMLFKYLSKDGDEGFPGSVELKVWYGASTEEVAGFTHVVLDVEYEAELVGDEAGINETAVSLTNHSYFNLNLAATEAGKSPSIKGTEVNLASNKYLVTDDTAIPTGAIEQYPGITANQPFVLGAQEPAIDSCFIFDDETRADQIPIDTRPLGLRRLAAFRHPATGINLEVSSTERAGQLYTGEYIDVPAIHGGGKEIHPPRGPRSGFCLEPSRYVDAVNRDEWRSMVILRKGEKYGSRIVYRAWQG